MWLRLGICSQIAYSLRRETSEHTVLKYPLRSAHKQLLPGAQRAVQEAESALGWGSTGQGRLPGGGVLCTELRRTLLLANLHHRQRKRGRHEWLAWGTLRIQSSL